MTKPHWFAIQEFNLADHVERMGSLHPEWSYKQCRCVLYWQNGVRKELDLKSQSFILSEVLINKLPEPGKLIYHKIPEAMGANVMLTMKRLKLPIEIKPVKIVRKIALIGYPGVESE